MEILQKHQSSFKTINVEKVVPVDYDLGNIVVFDINPLDDVELESHKEEYLRSISRDNTQLLFNQIFSLPTRVDGSSVIAELPKGITILPREKPIPALKPETKWEKFSKSKGIQNKKRSRMEYDEASGEYKPIYGYKSAKNEGLKDWIIEVPENADPFENQYEKRKEEKKERIQKNKSLQKKNLEGKNKNELTADSNNAKGLSRVEKKKILHKQSEVARLSTASLGRFPPVSKKSNK